MILAGHGIAWLPQSLVAGDIASGVLTVLVPGLPMEIRLYRNAERARPIVEKVWATAQVMAADYAVTA